MILKGTASSPGRAEGKISKREKPGISTASALHIPWEDAVREAVANLMQAKEAALLRLSPEEVAIFDALMMIAEDPMLKEKAEELGGKEPGPAHARQAADALAAAFDALEDDYIRARGADIRQVGALIAGAMEGSLDRCPGSGGEADGNAAPGKAERLVVVAKELTPSQTVLLDFGQICGIALEDGAVNSHASILARAIGIPCVVGMKGLLDAVESGQPCLLDADTGGLFIGEDLPKEPNKKAGISKWSAAGLSRFATADGHVVGLALNIGSAAEMRRALEMGFSGVDVGLMRTEFIYMGSDELPGEEEQKSAYREIAALAAPGRVRFRTLDIGGDKKPSFIDIPHEENPYLGLRSLRLSLKRPALFKAQLRALASVSCEFGIDVMFPMVSTAEELDSALAALGEAVAEVEAESGKATDIRAGIMAEVPSACILADVLSERCSFLSLGTNDLVQYTMAADRNNPAVADVYQQLNPAVLKLIHMCWKACALRGVELSACGELAGTPEGAMLLAGLGVGKLSMAAGSARPVGEALALRTINELREAAERALKSRTEAQVQHIIENI